MQGVAVTLQATAGTSVVSSDNIGHVTFNRNNGSWAYTIGDTGSYVGATGTVIVANGVVTAPTGGILTVTAIGIPAASAGAYLLANTEYKADGVTKFGAAGVTVKLVGLTWATGRVSSANNYTAEIMGNSYQTDINGQWGINLPQEAFTNGAWVTLEFSYTDSNNNVVVRTRSAILVAPVTGTTVYWSDLSPNDAVG
jgi:hypothetical protein